MKKQLSATKFKLRKGIALHTLNVGMKEIMELQVEALKAIAERKGWRGKYFFPSSIPGLIKQGKHGVVAHEDSEAYREGWIKEFVICLHSEASELLDMVNWKHWKETRQPVDWEEAKFEIVDLYIFVLNLALVSGMGPSELAQRVLHKMKVNIERQKTGY